MAQQDYADLKNAVEAAGYFGDYEDRENFRDRLVLASVKFENGYTGVLLWAATRGSHWYVATYLPRIYRIPEPERLADLAVAVLGGGRGTPYDFKPEIKSTFQLVELSEDDFDALC